MPADGTKRIKLYESRVQARGPNDQRWERMAPYIAPSRVGISGASALGNRDVYDSTTLMAGELMAQFIAGQIINPGQTWFQYTPYQPLDSKKDNDAIIEWCEECRDRTLRRHATSFFYAEGTEALIDFVGFGTGVLFCEEAPQPINTTLRGFRGFYFHAEKTGRFVIAEGPDGLVNEIDREFTMSAGKINERWGKDTSTPGSFPESIRQAIETGQPDRTFRIVHSIYPRPRQEQGYGAKGMPWASCWTDFDSKHVIYESGYKVFPAAVPRYHKTPGEVFGRGRGDIAFPDTWTLNTAKKMGLEDWALKIRPPILHHTSSIFGTLRLVPGAPTPVNTHGRPIRDVVAPYETGSRPEVSQIKEEELRKSIRSIYFVEQILQLLEVNKSEMTAFEFAKKINLLFQILGPVYGRTEWEMLYRVISTSFATQMEGGDFSPPPPQLERTNGLIAIEFQNPIARAQRAGDVEALAFAMSDLAPLANLNPDILDRFNPDEVALGVLSNRGVPAKWQRNNAEMEAFRKAKDEQNKREQQMAEAQQMAETAGKAAPAMKVLQEGAMGGNGSA